MSEGRQLVLLLAGALVLAIVGVVAATVFPEPCEEIEGIGSLELSFVDAAAALDVAAVDATAVEQLGEELGIGPWRGAVPLPPGTAVLPSDFGFFAVTDTDLVALRPGSARASAPRAVAGLTAVPVSGTSAGLVTPDREIAVVSSDYERERCGRLPDDGEVLAIDRGFALVEDAAGDPVLWTLSGDEVRSLRSSGEIIGGLVDGDRVVVVTADNAVAAGITDGAAAGEVALAGASSLAAVHGSVLVVEDAAPAVVRELTVDDDGLAVRDVAVDAPVVDAAPSPAGLVVATTEGLATDRGRQAVLPVPARSVVVSEDGHVGVVVDGATSPVLLVWGRDLPG